MTTELIKQFEEKFEEMKRELGFASNLEDLDKIFFLRDSILKEKYVSANLSRQVCGRIVETYMSWVNYLHSVIAPNPAYLVSINESSAFSERERENMARLISKLMSVVTKNTLVGITKDKAKEAEFIDGAVKFWNVAFKPEITSVLEKINNKRVKDSMPKL